MARLPDKSSRFVLISVFLFCTTFLFLDFKFNTFKPVQNFYSSSSIFIKIFSKEYIFVPIYSSLISNFHTQKVKEENRILKAELNEQLIINYILSNKNILNQNAISEKFDFENSSFIVIPSKVVDFDANQYFCCDKHRMILSSDNNIEVGSFKVVINKEGIIGQTLKLNKNFFEVILLSDKNHNLPIENKNDFYCEAQGLGLPQKIFCDVDLTLWDDNFEEEQKFFTSGLGGIFPSGIEIGQILEKQELSTKELRLIINLNANPLSSNFFGVLQ